MSPPISMDDSHSKILKSRLPRKTLMLGEDVTWSSLQCPLRKGILYYIQKAVILERNIYSPSKHEPRIIAKLRQTTEEGSSPRCHIVPINHNRILVMGMTMEADICFLHLSIHEIRSYRVGPTLWTYDGICGGGAIFLSQPMKSTTNNLGITFRGGFDASPINLFNVSTEKGDPLVEAGRLNYTRDRIHGFGVVLSPDRRILLHTCSIQLGEVIEVYYSGSDDTNNTDFSLVTHIPISHLNNTNSERKFHLAPLPAFSADGSKFATFMRDGLVSVWGIQNKIPLKVIRVEAAPYYSILFLQFSSGNIGGETLVFIEDNDICQRIRLIDATSFETEETLQLPESNDLLRSGSLFFDPSGRSMYAAQNGILYEWEVQKNEGLKCEWWLGEE